MSLPLEIVDFVVERLHATYGGEWVRKWEGLEKMAVKTIWMNELDGLRKEHIEFGLTNLPPKCPNAIEFRNLCRQAPAGEEPRLPEPKANPARVQSELAKLGGMRQAMAPKAGHNPHKDWARILIARHKSGERIRPICLRFAREALGYQGEAA